jgi:hypothetical protein
MAATARTCESWLRRLAVMMEEEEEEEEDVTKTNTTDIWKVL